MQIGLLNKRVELQQPTTTSDGIGGFTTVFSTIYTCFAAVWPISANEQIKNQQTSMEITHRVRIRYKSGIDASYRIKFGSRYFSIVSVINPNESNKMLELLCKESA